MAGSLRTHDRQTRTNGAHGTVEVNFHLSTDLVLTRYGFQISKQPISWFDEYEH